MDAPPIQYARTADGVNIAYSTLGAGPVYVSPQPPSSSGIQPSWADPYFSDFYGRLAESFTVALDHPIGGPVQRLRVGGGGLACEVHERSATCEASLPRGAEGPVG